ncbi:amidohydrolase family protein [Kribbella sp. NPDC048915]|uniref:metal-dependent hydrolase family protein n=1 Tax=Kribbella sp. NPDC048915 TaxID=3155148 RepID=UPI0033D9B83B
MKQLPDRYVLRGAAVLDPAGEFADGVDLLVSDGRIAQVGRGIRAEGIDSLDAGGLWIMPGLVDCHAHLTMHSLEPYQSMQRPITLWALQAADTARQTLRSGVTFARDAGGSEAGLKAAIAGGLTAGPRLQIAILMLSSTGAHADGFLAGPGLEASAWYDTPDYPGRPNPLVDGAPEMRRRVRELVRAGADWIKLCATGGLASEYDEPDAPDFAADEIAEAVAEGARRGRPVMVHCYGGTALDHSLRAGARSVEHGALLTEQQCAEMASRGCWLVPTRSALLDDVEQARSGRFSPVINEKTLRIEPALDDYVLMAREAGVRIATGTDGIEARRQARIVDELRALRQAGLTAAEVLAAATSEAAALCGVADQVGSIAPGFAADLIITESEPGADGNYAELDPPPGVIQAGRAVALPAQLSE